MELSAPRPRRKPSLTPMIDVVFLLLVFFMLASRFGMDMHLPLKTAGASTGESYQGPPRLVVIGTDGITLNGITADLSTLTEELEKLMEAPTNTVVLRSGEDTPLQTLVEVMSLLTAAGMTNLVLVN